MAAAPGYAMSKYLRKVAMRRRVGFTLIELLVVISIIALLMAILLPSLEKARSQAQSTACLQNIHQWGIVFATYVDDNNGMFGAGWIAAEVGGPEHQWMLTLKPYYRDQKLMVCPSANFYWSEGAVPGMPHSGWGVWPEDIEFPPYRGAYGGYGLNEWVSNPPKYAPDGSRYDGWWRDFDKHNWRTSNVRGGGYIPLFSDCTFVGGYPMPEDEPPAYPGAFTWAYHEMQRWCIDRHMGYINMVFLDFSARPVGLKELWQQSMTWHKTWTAEWQGLPVWPEWMHRLRDY